jgi:protoporphyrinogen oxidase
VRFRFDTKVQKIIKTNDQLHLNLSSSQPSQGEDTPHLYDAVISTLPSPVFQQLIDLPEFHGDLRGLGAMTLLLRLKRRLLPDDIYWLNVNEKNWPFVAVVEHTNYMSKEKYAGEHLVYLGRYLETSDPAFRKTAAQLLEDYRPFLRKLAADFDQQLIDIKLSKSVFAQPLSMVGQSRRNPSFTTSVPGLYWVSMQHVYPFDRGVNHAIGFARAMLKDVRIGASI